jgi:hypothetical protein
MTAQTQPWIPRGLLSEARLTATATSTSASATFIDIVGNVSTDGAAGVGGSTLQVAVGVAAGRRYKILAAANISSDTAGDVAAIQGIATASGGAAGSFVGLFSGVNNVDLRTTSFFNVGEVPGYYYCTASGLLTVKVQFHRGSGSGTVSVGGQSGIGIHDYGLTP